MRLKQVELSNNHKNKLVELIRELVKYVTGLKTQSSERNLPQMFSNPAYETDQTKQKTFLLQDEGLDTFSQIVSLIRETGGSEFLTGDEISKITWDLIVGLINSGDASMKNNIQLSAMIDQLFSLTQKELTRWEVLISVADLQFKNDLVFAQGDLLVNLKAGSLISQKWIRRITKDGVIDPDDHIRKELINENYAQITVMANNYQVAIRKAIIKLLKIVTTVNLIYKTRFVSNGMSHWTLGMSAKIFAFDTYNNIGQISFQRLDELYWQLNITPIQSKMQMEIDLWHHNFNHLSAAKGKEDQFLVKLDLAIKWYSNIIDTNDIDSQILYMSTILEILFIRKQDKSHMKGALIAFRISIFYYRYTIQKYLLTFNWLDLYIARNNIIHGDKSLHSEELDFKMDDLTSARGGKRVYKNHTRNMISQVGKLIYDVYSVYSKQIEKSKTNKMIEIHSIAQFIDWIDNHYDRILIDGISRFAKYKEFAGLWNSSNPYKSEFIKARELIDK